MLKTANISSGDVPLSPRMVLFKLLRGSAGLSRYDFCLLEASCVMESATAQLDKQRVIEFITKPQTLSGNAVEESRHVLQIVVRLRPSLFIKTLAFSLCFCLFPFSFISFQWDFETCLLSRLFGQKMALKGADPAASLGE
jgi:hypothetical protein